MSAKVGAAAASAGTDAAERSVLLLWMIFTGLSVFAAFLLWRYGLIRLMVTFRPHLHLQRHRGALCRHLRAIASGGRGRSRGKAEVARGCRAILAAPDGAKALARGCARPADAVSSPITSRAW